MHRLLLAVTAACLLAAGPVFAQPDHAGNLAPAKVAAAAAPAVVDPANPTHEECKAVMGRKMEPRATHDHGAMKGAPTTTPHYQKLSKDEMAKMHAKCAAKMGPVEAPK